MLFPYYTAIRERFFSLLEYFWKALVSAGMKKCNPIQ